MAMSSELRSRCHDADGNLKEVYWIYADATTGTFQADATQDLRGMAWNAKDSSTAGTVIGGNINLNTGVLTLTGMVAVNALTGVSGGAAGGFTFTGTGGVIGQNATGSANFQANTTVMNVSGTTITVDKALLGAIAAANMFTRGVLEVTYSK